MSRSPRFLALLLTVLFVPILAGLQGAQALPIGLSEMSSDATPAADLDAIVDFTIVGGDELVVILFNTTSAPNEFNMNELYFNGSSDVISLTLTSATHSVGATDVLADWTPVQTSAMADGFGIFDFMLADGLGEVNPAQVQPGTNITFAFDIAGACADAFDCDAFDDFLSIANLSSKTVAAKFVNGPDDPEAPGSQDSAFGASGVIPEPGTFGLTALGLGGLAIARRRRIV